MLVKDLLEALQSLPPDAELILQKDGEGNDYSPLFGVHGEAVYVNETTWSGRVFDTKGSADDACMDEEDWQELLRKPRCVVLVPVN